MRGLLTTTNLAELVLFEDVNFSATNAQDAILEAANAPSFVPYHLLDTETLTIPENKQLLVKGSLWLDGHIQINGELVLI